MAADGPVPDGLSAPARLRWKRGKETVKTAPSLCKVPKLEKKTGFFQNPGAFFRLLCYNDSRICPAAACPEGQQANPLFFEVISGMSATGAVVFLPREGTGVSPMLEELLFDPAALWLRLWPTAPAWTTP